MIPTLFNGSTTLSRRSRNTWLSGIRYVSGIRYQVSGISFQRLLESIKRIGRRYKYYITDLGRRVVLTGITLRELFVFPQLNALPSPT
ncbi:MAG: hypothetical protein ACM3ZE_31370 [Myxococcales bacterium]